MNICNNQDYLLYQSRTSGRGLSRRLEILPLKYVDGHSYGEVVSRVIADVDQFADGLLMGFTQLFTGVLTIVGTLDLYADGQCDNHAGGGFDHAGVFVCGKLYCKKNLYYVSACSPEPEGSRPRLIDEMIGNQKVVQAFGHQKKYAWSSFDEINEQTADNVLCVPSSFPPSPIRATRFVNSLVYAGVGVAGALTAIGGGMSVGQLCLLFKLCQPVYQAV